MPRKATSPKTGAVSRALPLRSFPGEIAIPLLNRTTPRRSPPVNHRRRAPKRVAAPSDGIDTNERNRSTSAARFLSAGSRPTTFLPADRFAPSQREGSFLCLPAIAGHGQESSLDRRGNRTPHFPP